MKKKILFLFSFFLFVLLIFNSTHVQSKKAKPPVGSCGDVYSGGLFVPAESYTTCAHSTCHPSPANIPTSNNVAILIGTGLIPSDTLDDNFLYTANTVYNISFMINSFTGRYGFQMSSLDANDMQAGRFNVLNAATTVLQFRKIGTDSFFYMGHLNASSTKTWTYKWTAPPCSTGPVTFYYAYNTADGNDTSDNDVIYAKTITIQCGGVGIESIDGKLSSLNIFPNPVSENFRISFNALQPEKISAVLYSLDGKTEKELMNEIVSDGHCSRAFSVDELPAGVYLLQLKAGNASVTKKILKQ